MTNKVMVIDILASKSVVISNMIEGYEDDDERKIEMYDELERDVICLPAIAIDWFRFWRNSLEDVFKIIEFLYQYDLSNKMVIMSRMREAIMLEPGIVVPDTTAINQAMKLGCWGGRRCTNTTDMIKSDHALCYMSSCITTGNVPEMVIRCDAINIFRLFDWRDYVVDLSIKYCAVKIMRCLYRANNGVYDDKCEYMMGNMIGNINNMDYINFCVDIGMFAKVSKNIPIAKRLMESAIKNRNMVVIDGLVENKIEWGYEKVFDDCANDAEIMRKLIDDAKMVHSRALYATMRENNETTTFMLCEKMDILHYSYFAFFCGRRMVNNMEIMEMMARKAVYRGQSYGFFELLANWNEDALSACIQNKYATLETIQNVINIVRPHFHDALFFAVRHARRGSSTRWEWTF